MDYNKLNSYTTEEQVIGNELNEILSKTPPRLFKLTLLAIALCMSILFVSSCFIKYKETVVAGFIMTTTNERQEILTIIADKSNIQKLATSKSAIIQSSGYRDNRASAVRIQFDSLQIEPYYMIGDTIYHYLSELSAGAADVNRIITRYKITIPVTTPQAKVLFEQDRETAGTIKFIVSETRLINKFIHLHGKSTPAP